MTAATLEESIYQRVKALCAEGDQLCAGTSVKDGIAKYVEALGLVPEPHTQWEAATWIYVAIGDAHFRTGNFEKMLRCFVNAVQCPGGLGNPYVHLRLGQAHFELGNIENAADELTRAYMGAGMKIFMEDDGKYLAFLETRIEL